MGRIGNIVNRKNKQDSKRAQAFTKYARLITVAAKMGGGDPEYNSALKAAVDKAKAVNMPNDNIDRAIKKGAGAGDSENFEHIVYEGYGPGGVAMIIETLTDNKNRTAGNVRFYLDKNSGNLGTSGCVEFMFDRKGVLVLDGENLSEDEWMEKALEAGAEDFIIEDNLFVIYTSPEDFYPVKDTLEKDGADFVSAEVSRVPQTYTAVDESHMKSMQKLLDMLDEDDDVQEVYTNLAE